MFDKRSPREAAPIVAETVLSNQIKLEGRLQSTSNIRFDGEMNGDLTTEGDLSVGEHGRVKGNVSGRNVVVGGMIRGNVNTTGRLEILATGKGAAATDSSPQFQAEVRPGRPRQDGAVTVRRGPHGRSMRVRVAYCHHQKPPR